MKHSLILLLILGSFTAHAQSKKRQAQLCRTWQSESVESYSSPMADIALLQYDMIEFYDDGTVRFSRPTDAGRYVTMGKWKMKDGDHIHIEGKEISAIEIEIVSLSKKKLCYRIRKNTKQYLAEVCMKQM